MDGNVFHPAKPKNNLDFFSKFVGKTVNNGNIYKAIFILVASFFFLWSMNAAFASDVSTCSTVDDGAIIPMDDLSFNDAVDPTKEVKSPDGYKHPVPSADIKVEKEFWNASEGSNAHSQVNTANYGDNVLAVVKVTNNGPWTVHTTVVNDVLPVGLVYVSHIIVNGDNHLLGNPLAYNATTGKWTIYNLGSGSSYYLAITCLVNKTGELTNVACKEWSSLYDPNRWNDRACASLCVPPAADISVAKEFWDGSEANKCAHIPVTTANFGTNVWAVVKVTNNGPDIGCTIVKDTLPVGLVYLSHAIFNGTDHLLDNPVAYNATTGEWTIYNMPVGSTYYLALYCLVNKTGNLTNIANKTCGCAYDPNNTNDNASANLTVPPAADLSITKSVDKTTAFVGETVNFTYIVQNHGPDQAVNVTVTDVMPSGLSFVSYTANYGTYDSLTGIWSIPLLPADAIAQLVITSLVENSGFKINNATVTSLTYDPILTNNNASASFDAIDADAAGGGDEDGTDGNDGTTTTVSAQEVGLQDTGMPLAALVLAILMVLAGTIVSRKK